MWFFVIVLAAVAIAISNIQYPLAREREQQENAERRVRALIQPELERNLEVLQYKKRSLGENKRVTVVMFDMTAWQTVANTALTLGIEVNLLSKLFQSYHLMRRANEIQQHIMGIIVGIGSVVKGEAHEENKNRLLELAIFPAVSAAGKGKV